jgi:hypothetical protein
MAKPFDPNEPLAQLDVLARLHALPDAVALTTSEAAVFLRSSVSALEAMRSAGTGPTYIQAGGKGSRGSNQKCLYEKADLLAWQRANKVSSTVEAAVRKGQLFMALGDLAQVEAFWIDADGQVVGMVEAAPVATVIEHLGVFDIEWMLPTEAAGRSWGDIAEHRAFGSALASILQRELRRVEAGFDASEIAAAAHAPKEES